MAVSPAGFRAVFPEFASTTIYPDTQVQFWLTLAGKMLIVCRWGDVLEEGTYLYAAHNLYLQPRVSGSLTDPGPAGAAGGGMVSQKSVDKVSISYDTASVAVEGGGDWNATSYGRRFYQLMMLIGAGAIQL